MTNFGIIFSRKSSKNIIRDHMKHKNVAKNYFNACLDILLLFCSLCQIIPKGIRKKKHVQTCLILGLGMTSYSERKEKYSLIVHNGYFILYLLMNPSKPDRLSSMKSSSKIPSSLRNSICFLRALLGSGGTTILRKMNT